MLTAALLLAGALPLMAQPAKFDLNQILTRMEQARVLAKQTGPFVLTREYRMYHGDDSNPTSEVKAQISVMPPNRRDFKIVEAKGNSRGETVVRKILEHEARDEKADPPPGAIIRENYNFTYLGEEQFQGIPCYVLALHPKREATSLIEGKAWVDANSFLVRKIEGSLSKSPSWWVRGVWVNVEFGEVGGVWMQTSTDATADVRLLGKYTVDGWATGVQAEPALASQMGPRHFKKRHGRGVPAEVVLMPR